MISDLPENQLVDTINTLKTEFQTIKNKQIVGTESQESQRYFTGFSTDITAISSTFNVQQFRVTFIPNNTVQFQGLVYRIMYTVTPSSSFFYEVSFIRESVVGVSQSWLFTVLSDPGNIDFKFYLAGASDGTLTYASV